MKHILLFLGLILAPYAVWGMSEKPTEPFVVEKDEFILGEIENAEQMKQRLGYIVKIYGNNFDQVNNKILKDNPDIRQFSSSPDNFFWILNKQIYFPLPRIEVYNAGVQVKDGKIIDYGCNRGSR